MPALKKKVPEPQKASEGTCFSKRFSINFSDAIFMFIGFLNNRPVLFRILLANQNPGYDVFPTCAPSSSSQPASRWSSRTHSRHMRGNLPGNKPQLNTSVPPVLICHLFRGPQGFQFCAISGFRHSFRFGVQSLMGKLYGGVIGRKAEIWARSALFCQPAGHSPALGQLPTTSPCHFDQAPVLLTLKYSPSWTLSTPARAEYEQFYAYMLCPRHTDLADHPLAHHEPPARARGSTHRQPVPREPRRRPARFGLARPQAPAEHSKNGCAPGAITGPLAVHRSLSTPTHRTRHSSSPTACSPARWQHHLPLPRGWHARHLASFYGPAPPSQSGVASSSVPAAATRR